MRSPLILPAIFGSLAVILGALGAHALHNFLTQKDTVMFWHVAVQYQFYHTLAMLALTLTVPRFMTACWLWAGGIVLFSGSLYVLALTGMHWLGMITPFGGLLFLAGWVSLFFFRKG